MRHNRLFIPGPTEVTAENLAALAKPQIGHRGKEYQALHGRVVPKLQTLLETKEHVFLFTSSSTGVWEAAVRNCVRQRVLCCVQGAFSERWKQVAELNGKEVGEIRVDWGGAIKPGPVDDALSTGKFDAIALVHNETSTGAMNRLDELAQVVRKYPDVTFMVDAVSSMAGAPLPVDELGIDICLAGLQKAFSLPAGLAVASVSRRALDKARSIPNRGYYFDLIEILEYHERNQTPSTPAIPQIHALDVQLDAILEEGLARRYERHAYLASIVQDWGRERFSLFPEPGYESVTLTCVRNDRGISLSDLNAELGRQFVQISNGYGQLKDKAFRIAHMGDTQEWEIRGLLATIDRIIAE